MNIKRIKHLLLVLTKQEEELLLSKPAFKEQRQRHCPKQGMRQNNTILRGMIVKHPILFLWMHFLQSLLHLSKLLFTYLLQFIHFLCFFFVAKKGT